MKYQMFKLIVVVDSIYSSLFYAVYASFRSDLDYANHVEYISIPKNAFNPVTEEAIESDFK